MAFPHPQARQDHDREEDKSGWGSILRKFVERTVNVAVNRNANHDVNPAKNRSLLRDLRFHGQASFFSMLISMSTLLQPREHTLQVADKLLPAVACPAVFRLLLGREARLLHAHEGSALGRDQCPNDDAPQPQRAPGIREL